MSLLLLLCLWRSALADDPVDTLPEPLDPATFVSAVLARSPRAAGAEAAVRAAEARRDGADAFPAATVSAELAPAMLLDAPPGYQVGAELMLPAPGSRRAARLAADAQIRASEADLDAARAELAAMAVEALADRWVAGRALTALADQRAWMATTLEGARGRLAAGRGEAAELWMAEAELARMDAEIAQMQAEARDAEARMNALLHRPADLAVPAVTLGDPPGAAQGGAPPASRAGAARAEAASAEIDMVKAMNRPMIGLMAGHSTMMRDPHMSTVGVELVIPWGASARLDEARAMATMASDERDAMDDEVAARIAGAKAGITAAQRQWELLDGGLVPALQRGFEAEKAALAAGMGGLEPALRAARELRAAELERDQASAARWRWSAELTAATGLSATKESP